MADIQTEGDASAWVADYLRQSTAAMQAFCADSAIHALLLAMGEQTASLLRAGGKLLLCGNGGSAADAQHLATEFTSRLMYDRDPIAAVALTTDSSALTAIGNDYGFDELFSRQVRALARPGDVLLAISTSGRSPNVLRAIDAGKQAGLLVLGFTGADGRDMRGRCDLLLEAPAGQTAVVQQLHITAGHVLCGLVERSLHPQA